MKAAGKGEERFQGGARSYAAYLETPEGRLRLDLAFANLQEFLPRPRRSARALDLGGGTGATAIRLARLGFHVTVLDSAPAMLEIAKRAAQKAGVSAKIMFACRNATQAAKLFHGRSFDVILCHNLLEYLDRPGQILRAAARLLRGPSAVLSLLVRNQAGEALRAAIQAGDLIAARRSLTAHWGQESLYGGRVRLFTAEALPALLKSASLTVTATRGVRVASDYLPSRVSRTAQYRQILALERKLGSEPRFAAVARYSQCLVHRTRSLRESGK
ncbi:MAG TPA: methyltransferase domain-containing protein [Terriglobales bacterium]|jgi:S-adenosylmethionine-dependent methyltransferase|nr:methyltransferase domain-containing protein [Terriglobales bacterium]